MRLRLIILAISSLMLQLAAFAAKPALDKPDLDKICRESTDENSRYYYPKLLKEFMANDTTMTPEDFQYFYYGTFFQEDYDPYRGPVHPDELSSLAHVYAKEKRTRAERQQMLNYALDAIADNPVNLRQLTNRIYVYEQNGKFDLARIWQYKLNHLLLAIASSGTGADADNAWIVVYPQDEYDFLNLSGHIATGQKFEPPHFDYITVQPKSDAAPKGYYFNIGELLRQYYLKHPSEMSDASSSAEF